jgi:hypothetical protein
VHNLRRTYHRLGNHFLAHPVVLLEDVKWDFVSVRLEIVLVSVLDGCTVYVECTTGMEIIFGTPGGTPRRRGSSGISFRSGWR